MYSSISTAALIVGVSISTLRRWEKENKFLPCFRTVGGHRRYSIPRLKETFLKEEKVAIDITGTHALSYARVSSSDQRSDLATQVKKLELYCQKNFTSYDIVTDLGSGLNYKKPGLKKVLKAILRQEISHLVLNHKDRLLRFGPKIIFDLCAFFGVNVIILEQKAAQSFDEKLAADVLELITVFSGRLYGRRSHLSRQRVAA